MTETLEIIQAIESRMEQGIPMNEAIEEARWNYDINSNQMNEIYDAFNTFD